MPIIQNETCHISKEKGIQQEEWNNAYELRLVDKRTGEVVQVLEKQRNLNYAKVFAFE